MAIKLQLVRMNFWQQMCLTVLWPGVCPLSFVMNVNIYFSKMDGYLVKRGWLGKGDNGCGSDVHTCSHLKGLMGRFLLQDATEYTKQNLMKAVVYSSTAVTKLLSSLCNSLDLRFKADWTHHSYTPYFRYSIHMRSSYKMTFWLEDDGVI